jgi:hypothetical protein
MIKTNFKQVFFDLLRKIRMDSLNRECSFMAAEVRHRKSNSGRSVPKTIWDFTERLHPEYVFLFRIVEVEGQEEIEEVAIPKTRLMSVLWPSVSGTPYVR